jgi:hypothetical protein
MTWFHAAPAITTSLDGRGGREVVELTVWISDREGDPVDLTVRWLEADQTATASEKLVVISATYGHGTEGLTTQDAIFDPEGASHLLAWDVTDLESGQVKLRFVPRDLPGDAGETAESPAFDPKVGLEAPQTFISPPVE